MNHWHCLIFFSFIVLLTLCWSFAKYDGFSYLKYSLNLLLFIFVSSFATLHKNFPGNLDENFLAYCFISIVVPNTVASGTYSGAGSGVAILTGFFVENLFF